MMIETATVPTEAVSPLKVVEQTQKVTENEPNETRDIREDDDRVETAPVQDTETRDESQEDTREQADDKETEVQRIESTETEAKDTEVKETEVKEAEDKQNDVNDADAKEFAFSLWAWLDPTYTPDAAASASPGERESVPQTETKEDEALKWLNGVKCSAPDDTDWGTTAWSEFMRWIDPEISSSEAKRSHEMSPKQVPVNAEEESTASTKDGSIKFTGDLQSVPSEEDGESHIESQSLNTADVLGQTDEKTAASLVEKKLSNWDINKNTEAKEKEAEEKEKDNEKATENRRVLLVKELRDAVTNHGRYDVRCANASAALGDLLLENGQKDQAIKLHKDAVTIYTCKLGDDNDITLNAKVRLGAVLEDSDLYDEAISMYYLATSMRRSLLSDTNPVVADGYSMMAHVLRKKGDHHQAIKELKRALKIYREALGDTNDKVSTTVDDIASLYVVVGDFEKSAAILEEVVKLKAATHGASHVSVAETLSSLASSHEKSSQFDKAMKALKKAYKIYTEIGGYSSEDSTSVLNRMAQLYEASEDNHRAAIAYLGVLRGRKVNSGPASLLVGDTYYRLGRVLRRTDQLDKALKCMKEALPLFVNQAVEIADAEMIAEIMHEMALINKDRNNHADCARIFKQELSVRKKIGQPEFPTIARTLNHLGVAEFELCNHTRALKFLVEALSIFQKQEGGETLDCAEVLFNTGLVFESVKNHDKALEAFKESVRIFKNHKYDLSHPRLSKAVAKVEKIEKMNWNNAPKTRSGEKGSVMKRLFK